MSEIQPRTAQSPRTWKQALTSLWGPTGMLLLGVFLANLLLDQVFTNLIQDELMSSEGASNWIWFYGAISFSTGLIGPILLGFLTLCAWRYPTEPILRVAGKHLSYLVREEMRVMGQTLMWGLLLIIPGLIRFLTASFVSFVVLLDDRYQRGEVDALKRSTLFVKQVWGRLILLFVGFGILIPLLMTTLDEWRSLTDRPVTAFPISLVDFVVFLTFQWLLLKAWEKARDSVPDVSVV